VISSWSGRHGSYLASVAAVAFILSGCANTALERAEPAVLPQSTILVSPSSPPTPAPSVTPSASPPPSAEVPLPAPSSSVSSTATLLPVMAESLPVSVRIPSTDTQSELLSLGLEDNGSLEVPPGNPGAPAGWYNQSPTPGERGPAVLLGHVNATDGGPGVFAHLRELTTGDTIEVTRADGTTAVFAFTHGEQYSKDAFPTQTVYGNTEGSELRLITCDGYDPDTGEFDDNYVVYAKLLL
jgi:hypothetical protein